METPGTTSSALRDLAAFVHEAAAAGVLNAAELEDNGLLAAADAALAAPTAWTTTPPTAPSKPSSTTWWWWVRRPGALAQAVQVRFVQGAWHVQRGPICTALDSLHALRPGLAGVWLAAPPPIPPRCSEDMTSWEGAVA